MSRTYDCASANVSEDGVYRYYLMRRWPAKHDGVMCFVMLNPSTADGEQDDPTIRRCVEFADRQRCDQLVVVNLFAYRATDPTALKEVPFMMRFGPRNHEHLSHAIQHADIVVAAWGASYRGQKPQVPWGAKIPMCLGKTADGSPRHPLYVRADAPLTRYL